MMHYFRTEQQARKAVSRQTGMQVMIWQQRGQVKGWLGLDSSDCREDVSSIQDRWNASRPIYLSGWGREGLPGLCEALVRSADLVTALCQGEEADVCLDRPCHQAALQAGGFERLACSEDMDDPQEICKIDFDRYDGDQLVAGDLWLKIAWLSLQEGDPSLRFRFSHGLEGDETITTDRVQQIHAAELCETLFQESSLISRHGRLRALLEELGVRDPRYVERIVYFNAPDGGALFHQDVERGHCGVVYAQMTGETFWLALSREQLLNEVTEFLQQDDEGVWQDLSRLDPDERVARLEAREDRIEQLLNRTPEFSVQLLEHGHGYWLRPGDLLLLPQIDETRCAWHAVHTLGEVMGEGLSFAIREGE